MPVTTRCNARSEQTPDLVASLGDGATNFPKRHLDSRQAEAEAPLPEADAEVGDPAEVGTPSTSGSSAGNYFAAGYTISKCLRRRCMTCPKFVISTEIVSNITKINFSIINHSNKNITCDFQNLVHMFPL